MLYPTELRTQRHKKDKMRWVELDLNQRREASIDLQSIAFNRSATYPLFFTSFGVFGLVGFEPTTPCSQNRYATSAPQTGKMRYNLEIVRT